MKKILLPILILTSFLNLKIHASHALPIVGLSYTVGPTGVTISGSSDPATCAGGAPYWMQTKVTCNPTLFANTPIEPCLNGYLQSWTSPAVTFNSFPWFNSLLNVPGYTAANSWPDGCALEAYHNTFIPFADLCPGKVYYFATREVVTNGGGNVGNFGPVNSFTVPGTFVPCTPGFITSNPVTSPSSPSCGGGVMLTFNPPIGCSEKKTPIPGCGTCDTLVWLGPSGVVAVNTLTVMVFPTTTTTYTLAWDTCSPIRKVNCCCAPYDPTITVYVANTNALFTASSNTICAGASVVFNAMMPAPVDIWNVSPPTGVTPPTGNSPIYNPTFNNPGTYVVTHQSINGPCTDVKTQTITVGAGITTTITTAGGGCGLPSGTGSATIAVTSSTAGITYAWAPSGGSGASASGLLYNTTYSVTLTNAGCIVTKTLQIANSPAPIVTSFNVTQPLCNGQSNGVVAVNLTSGNPPFVCAWSSGITQTTQTVSGVGAGTYSVTITDNNGCTTFSVVTVAQPSALTLTTSSSATICSGRSTTITATVSGGTPAYSYTWNPGNITSSSTVVSPSSSTNYICTIKDANGCTTTQSISITVTPSLGISASTKTICINNSVVLTPNIISAGNGSALSYTWLPSGLNTPTLSYTGSSSGIQNITVIASDGCSLPNATAVFTVFTSPNPSANIVADSLIGYAPLQVDFNDLGSGGTSFNWNFGNGNTSTVQNPSTQTYTAGGNYSVTYTVTNAFGCSGFDTLNIKVIDLVPAIIVPNVFTPNGDKSNDVFKISGINVTTYECLIYNRWGKLVFSGSDVISSWDGKINGNPADEGTYFYVITASGAVGDPIKKQGYVSLFR
jgi:gliding motility-associated-like protein